MNTDEQRPHTHTHTHTHTHNTQTHWTTTGPTIAKAEGLLERKYESTAS